MYRPKDGKLYNVTDYAFMTVRPYYHFEPQTVEKPEKGVRIKTKKIYTKTSTMMRVVELDCDKLGIDFGDRVDNIDVDQAREAEWREKYIAAKKAEVNEKLDKEIVAENH